MAAAVIALGCLAAALAAAAIGRWSRVASLIALLGFACVAGGALLATPTPPLRLGAVQLVDSAWLRAWIGLAAISVGGSWLISRLAGVDGSPTGGTPTRSAHGAHGSPAALVMLGALALAFAASDASFAVLAAAAAAFCALPSAAPRPSGAEPGRAYLPWLRISALVPGIALLATVQRLGTETDLAAFALMGTALVLRLGLVPIHLPVLRLASGSSLGAVSSAAAWVPGAAVLIAIAWVSNVVVGTEADALRYVLVLLAALTILLAAVAMLVQDDFGRLVAAAALALMAPAGVAYAADQPDMAAVRTLVLAGAMGASALAGWAACVRLATGSRRNSGAAGWLRRAPLAGIALLAIPVGTAGWPGSPVWEARRTIVESAVTGPLATVIVVGLVAASLAPLRLLRSGLRRARPAQVVEPSTPQVEEPAQVVEQSTPQVEEPAQVAEQSAQEIDRAQVPEGEAPEIGPPATAGDGAEEIDPGPEIEDAAHVVEPAVQSTDAKNVVIGSSKWKVRARLLLVSALALALALLPLVLDAGLPALQSALQAPIPFGKP